MQNKKPSGFSERQFEYAFNSEYARILGSKLVSLPYIPSQNLEKILAYDVRFRINNGTKVESIFLQHKVPNYFSQTKPKKSTVKSKFGRVAGPNFYRIQLDVSQYNKILKLAKAKRAAYFCAPVFVGARRIVNLYKKKSVVAKSIWIDVSGCAALRGPGASTAHSLVYNETLNAWRFSDPVKVNGIKPYSARFSKNRAGENEKSCFAFTEKNIRELLLDVIESCKGEERNTNLSLAEPSVQASMTNMLERIFLLTSKEMGLTWILSKQ
jgi:hypothetical protein